MSGPALAKAKLIELQEDLITPLDGGKKIDVQFNPDSLKVTYANEVKQPEGGDQAAGTSGRQFVGAGTTKLALTLWFDVTSMTDNPVDDVRRLTKDVIFFMTPKESDDPTKFIPPGTCFQWGSFIFNGMIEGMEETLEFFSPDGKPLRASMSLTLSQQKILVSTFEQPNSAKARAGQRPFKSAKQGDSLQNMAGAAGKGGDWQSIASANGIEDPLRLSAGAMIDLNAGVKFSGSAGLSASISAPSIDIGASIQVGGQIAPPRLGIN
jgi:Contractile injection system tube protein